MRSKTRYWANVVVVAGRAQSSAQVGAGHERVIVLLADGGTMDNATPLG